MYELTRRSQGEKAVFCGIGGMSKERHAWGDYKTCAIQEAQRRSHEKWTPYGHIAKLGCGKQERWDGKELVTKLRFLKTPDLWPNLVWI